MNELKIRVIGAESMRIFLLVSLSWMMCNSIMAQEKFTHKLINDDRIEDVLSAEEIVFYGYDFSQFKLAEEKRFMESPIILRYIPRWQEYLKGVAVPKALKREFVKPSVKVQFEPTNMQVESMDTLGLQIVSFDKHLIAADMVPPMIQGYDLAEKTGVGFVIIVECFEKITETSTAYFVFFDIASRQIMMADYFGSAEADGRGLILHWGIGVQATFKKYLADYYRKRLKEYQKEMKKRRGKG